VKLTPCVVVVLTALGACAEEAPKYADPPDVSSSVGEGGSAGEAQGWAGEPGAANSGASSSEAGGSGGEAAASAGASGASEAAAGAEGEGAECAVARDCPARECLVADCRENRCEYDPEEMGAACGDAGELACDGRGECVECLDDDECPPDGACSVGNCTAQGTCEQRPLDEGQSCSDGTFCNGSETCDGLGACRSGNEPCSAPTTCDEDTDQCVGCVDDSDCPEQTPACDPDDRVCVCTGDEDCAIADECRVGRCDARKCVVENVDPATPVGVQTAGDCKRRECNGGGAVVFADDDGDAPVDPGEPCIYPVCQNGEVVQAPRAPGTDCGSAATECSGGDTCDGSGACQPNHVSSGTVLRAETAGDCRRRTCDGAGNAVETPISAVCNDDAFCNGTETCSSGGVCESSGDPCVGTTKPYCVGSACQACSMNSQCDGLDDRSGRCVGVCVECTDATLRDDCGGDETVVGCMGGRCYVKCNCSDEACGRPHSTLCARR